jgi:hypothetical protein
VGTVCLEKVERVRQNDSPNSGRDERWVRQSRKMHEPSRSSYGFGQYRAGRETLGVTWTVAKMPMTGIRHGFRGACMRE